MKYLLDTYIHPFMPNTMENFLEMNRLSEGKVVELFEKELCNQFNLPNLLTVNSGTSALHLALELSGVKLRQEIIIPAQTFVATGLSVLYKGANVVFADINKDGGMSAKDFEKKITKRTKAVIVVHWAGQVCDDLEEIQKIAKDRNIVVIEDAAQALGAKYKNGKWVGDSDSDFVTFSFQASKLLTTGDGGGIVCKNSEHYELGRKLRWFGIDRTNDQPDETGERSYNLERIGYKYHMNDYAAILGFVNSMTAKQRVRYKRFLAKLYWKYIEDKSILIHSMKSDMENGSFWSFPILVPRRRELIKELKSKGYETSVIHSGIDRNDVFGGKDKKLITQREFDEKLLHLPCHHNITPFDVLDICYIINNGW